MNTIDLDPFLDQVRAIVGRAELAPGLWKRYACTTGEDRDQGANPYGCADAINLLATLGELPRDPAWRAAAVAALHGMQADDGLFREATHHDIHCTAHCLAALFLLDAGPRVPLVAFAPLADPAAIGPFLDRLDWGRPWQASHQGAGIYAALHLAGASTPAWEEAYFAWLWEEADPGTGFWRRGWQRPVRHHNMDSHFPHLAGSFHYLFNHEHARRPLRFPVPWIDTCLGLRRNDPFPLGRDLGFAEIDWVYCLTRASRQCAHRADEVRAALAEFTPGYVTSLMMRDPEADRGLNDLHALFGVLCCLAELQTALPGLLRSRRPLHLVLDRRPFI
jgi:hypothetical protein